MPYGIPFTVVDGSHPKVQVAFDYADESDRVRYPLGSDTKIEGGRSADGDRHAIVVDKSTLPALRDVRDLPARQRLDRGLRRGLVADQQQAAAAGLDVGRRGRAADPARPAPLPPR